jgi:hypothetical protein
VALRDREVGPGRVEDIVCAEVVVLVRRLVGRRRDIPARGEPVVRIQIRRIEEQLDVEPPRFASREVGQPPDNLGIRRLDRIREFLTRVGLVAEAPPRLHEKGPPGEPRGHRDRRGGPAQVLVSHQVVDVLAGHQGTGVGLGLDGQTGGPLDALDRALARFDTQGRGRDKGRETGDGEEGRSEHRRRQDDAYDEREIGGPFSSHINLHTPRFARTRRCMAAFQLVDSNTGRGARDSLNARLGSESRRSPRHSPYPFTVTKAPPYQSS